MPAEHIFRALMPLEANEGNHAKMWFAIGDKSSMQGVGLGAGNGLQSSRWVCRLADRSVLLRHAFAYKIPNDNHARGDADPRLQSHVGSGFQPHDIEDREAGAHCPLGVVLMSSGPEIGEYTVAEIICNCAPKALDPCRTGRKKCAGDVALFFRVELARKRSRTDFAEHTSQNMLVICRCSAELMVGTFAAGRGVVGDLCELTGERLAPHSEQNLSCGGLVATGRAHERKRRPTSTAEL
jgi:hypothetical protein